MFLGDVPDGSVVRARALRSSGTRTHLGTIHDAFSGRAYSISPKCNRVSALRYAGPLISSHRVDDWCPACLHWLRRVVGAAA